MSELEQPILKYDHKIIDQLVPHEPNDREIFAQGDLFDFFRVRYFPDYFKSFAEYYPRANIMKEEVMDSLQVLLPLVLSSPLCDRRALIGSTAKCLIHEQMTLQFNKEARLPIKHWDFRPEFCRKAKKLKADNKGIEATWTESFAEDADIDFKVRFKGRNKTGDLAKWLFNTLNRQGRTLSNVRRMEIYDRKTGDTYAGIGFEVLMTDSIRIVILGSQIPTNTSIGVLKVDIYDRSGEKVDREQTQYGRRLMHIDLTDMPKDAEIAESDARGGATHDKGDKSVVEVSVGEDGHISYTISTNAAIKLYCQDAIVVKPERLQLKKPDNACLNEVPFRALRTGMVFDLGHTLICNEYGQISGDLSLPDLRLLFSRFTSESLFMLRDRIRELVDNKIGFKPERLVLVEKELAMCSWIDPVETIQFIRDSGIYLLIPGWKEMTYEEWNQVLASPQLCLEEVNGTVSLRPEERKDLLYQARQSKLYKNGPFFDGLERVMRALGSQVGEEITDYLHIWKPVEIITAQVNRPSELRLRLLPERPRNNLAIVRKIKLHSGEQTKQVYLVVASGTTLNDKELMAVGEELYLGHLPPDHQERRAVRSIPLITRCSEGTALDKERKLIEDLPENNDGFKVVSKLQYLAKVREIAFIYAVLEHYFVGLTARDLKGMYITAAHKRHVSNNSMMVETVDFKTLFHYLIMTGLVRRISQQRVDKYGKIVPIEFYIASPEPRRHEWKTLRQDPQLALMFGDYLNCTSEIARYRLKYVIDELLNPMGITTYEAFEAMTYEDFEMCCQMARFQIDNETMQLMIDLLRTTSRYLLSER